MNSIIITILISVITLYMMSISYTTYYFIETVCVYKKNKTNFYNLEGLLLYGKNFYKKNHESITLPYSFSVNWPCGRVATISYTFQSVLDTLIFVNIKGAGSHSCLIRKLPRGKFEVIDWSCR